MDINQCLLNLVALAGNEKNPDIMINKPSSIQEQLEDKLPILNVIQKKPPIVALEEGLEDVNNISVENKNDSIKHITIV